MSKWRFMVVMFYTRLAAQTRLCFAPYGELEFGDAEFQFRAPGDGRLGE
jgi:hypothetical protein